MLTTIQNLLYTCAISFDLPILDWIQANLQSGFMDTVMPIITLFGDAGIFWIVCSAILILIPKTRRTGLGMMIAMMIGLLVCNVTLKPLIARIRPYDLQAQLGVTIKLLGEAMHDFSFPSGHTIASFEAATVLLKHDRKLGIPAMILAVLIAFSRLYLYVHYPTDVLCSIVLGIIIAFIGDALAGLIAPALTKRKRGKYEV